MKNNRYEIEREFNKAVDLYYNMEKYKKKISMESILTRIKYKKK